MSSQITIINNGPYKVAIMLVNTNSGLEEKTYYMQVGNEANISLDGNHHVIAREIKE